MRRPRDGSGKGQDQKMNESPQDPGRQAHRALADEIRRSIDERSPLDSLAAELAKLRMELDQVGKALRSLQAQRAMSDVLLPEARLLYQGVSHARVDAGMLLSPQQGFYNLEYDSRGRTYRWTGPRARFHIDLHVDRSGPLKLTLRLGPSQGCNDARVYCDGSEVVTTLHEDDDGFVLEGMLMPRAAQGLTRIHGVPLRMEALGEQNGDARLLGVVFRALEVSPVSAEAAREFLAEHDDAQLPSVLSEGTDAADEPSSPPEAASDPDADDGVAAAGAVESRRRRGKRRGPR